MDYGTIESRWLQYSSTYIYALFLSCIFFQAVYFLVICFCLFELGLTFHQHIKVIRRRGPRFKISSEWLVERRIEPATPVLVVPCIIQYITGPLHFLCESWIQSYELHIITLAVNVNVNITSVISMNMNNLRIKYKTSIFEGFGSNISSNKN